MSQYQHILAATDLHNDYFPVVKKAVEIAQQNQAKLSVVNVIPNIPAYIASGLVNDIEDELEEESESRLKQVKSAIEIPADFYVRHGSAKVEIVRLGAELKADLIVIGSHGKRGVQMILGSTASGVLHRADCDVLVVRTAD